MCECAGGWCVYATECVCDHVYTCTCVSMPVHMYVLLECVPVQMCLCICMCMCVVCRRRLSVCMHSSLCDDIATDGKQSALPPESINRLINRNCNSTLCMIANDL